MCSRKLEKNGKQNYSNFIYAIIIYTNLNIFVVFKTLLTNLLYNYKIVLPDKLQKIWVFERLKSNLNSSPITYFLSVLVLATKSLLPTLKCK